MVELQIYDKFPEWPNDSKDFSDNPRKDSQPCITDSFRRREQLVGHLAEFLIPLLAEAADERPVQESVDGHAQFAALRAAVGADAPLVVVEADESLAEILLADGVEGAADGFRKK